MPDYETLQRIGKQNMRHVMYDNCTDPDCELHHPEVGIAEETVGLTDLAFWVAGYFAGVGSAQNHFDGLLDNVRDELLAPGGPLTPSMIQEFMADDPEND